MENDAEGWVKSVIRNELAKRERMVDNDPEQGALEELAQNWGFKPHTLRRWWRENGGVSSELVPSFLKAAGGDFERALPGWAPENWNAYKEANKDYVAKNKRLASELKVANEAIEQLNQRLLAVVRVAKGEDNVVEIHKPIAHKVAEPGGKSNKEDNKK